MRLHPARAVGLLRAPWIPGWSKDPLWRRARAVPSLDLQFADTKSLVDATTGQNLVTFSRASGGTYVDSQGVIRNATTNLLPRSEEFDNASWVKTRSSVTANAIVAPDGSLTADRINEDATPTSTHLVAQTGSLISTVGARYTYSVYAKADGRNWLVVSPGGTWGYAWFDISSGTLGTVVDGGGATTASITEAGNGWYRCIVSATAVDARGLQLLLSNANNVVTYTGDGTSGIYLWGAQLEQSSTVGEYIPTTSSINSAPRFDHDPSTGESLGLLVEEQRTNLLLRSEEFDTTWTNSATTDATNVAIAPNGAQTADEVIENNGLSLHYMAQSIAKASSAITYAASIFVKRTNSGTRNVCLTVTDGTTGGLGAIFDPDDGSIVSSSTAIGSITGWSISALPGQSFGNGWWRFSIVVTTNTSTRADIVIYLANGSTLNYTGDGISSLYIWGAQLEQGTFPTSYIKNVDTPGGVTRAADIAQITGTNFSSWYNQSEGTVFAEITPRGIAAQNYAYAIDLANSFANSHLLYAVNGSPRAETFVGSVIQAQITSNLLVIGQVRRFANIYRLNDFALASDGALSGTDVSGSLPAPTSLKIGTSAGGLSPLNGTLKRLTFWPQRLSNATLQSITQ